MSQLDSDLRLSNVHLIKIVMMNFLKTKLSNLFKFAKKKKNVYNSNVFNTVKSKWLFKIKLLSDTHFLVIFNQNVFNQECFFPHFTLIVTCK